jgi:polyisoprenoid-binding protein YceI
MKLKRGLLGIVGALVLMMATVPMATADEWAADPGHSLVNFKVRHFFSKAGGSFGEWEATIHFDPENPEAGSVNATIQAASIDTDDEKRDGHLKSPDFFDVENHPTITFTSTAVEKHDDGLMLTGKLTMRGVTKEISFPFEFNGAGADGWGGTRAGFSAELVVNRKDYGISWNKDMDKGGVVLGEKVTIELEIEAVKKPS